MRPKIAVRSRRKLAQLEKARTVKKNRTSMDCSLEAVVFGGEDMQPKADFEPPSQTSLKSDDKLIGRRLVSTESWIWSVNAASLHGRKCDGHISFKEEKSFGMKRRLLMGCDVCQWKEWAMTDKPTDSVNLPISDAIVWATNASGSTFEAAKQFMTVLDVPFPTFKTFAKRQGVLIQQWNVALESQIRENGVRDKELAVAAGKQVLVDGQMYPSTTVYADGGWCSRSYGHSYKSKGGVAVLIGAFTKKILHLGVKNMFCSVCHNARKKGGEVKEHQCYKNWTDDTPATAMEPEIILEGFRQSVETHGLVFTDLVADGDASVYNTVLKANVYPGIRVNKAECVNHAVKRLNGHLYDLAKDSSLDIDHRNLLKSLLPRMGKSVRAAINYRAGNQMEADLLRGDIANVPLHTYGDHSNCKSYFCNQENQQGVNHVPPMVNSKLWKLMISHFNRLSYDAPRLLPNLTNNISETFMSRVSKFNHGKRTNVVQRGGWKLRATSAALSFNVGPCFYSKVLKPTTGRTPLKNWRKAASESSNKEERHKKRVKQRPKLPFTKFNKKAKTTKINSHRFYGPRANAPDIPGKLLDQEIEKLICEKQVTMKTREEIEAATRHQSANDRWFVERQHRITASIAGKLFKLRDTTNSSKTIMSFLYEQPLAHVSSINHGNFFESQAIAEYNALHNNVKPCGLFVSLENGIFAASPDGLVGTDGLLEVKCPATLSSKGLPPEEMQRAMKQSYLVPVSKEDPSLQLSRKHPYFYQVVQQLHVTGKEFCDFVVFSFKQENGKQVNFPLFIERIFRNGDTSKVWEKMKEKLEKLYKLDLAPEIVDPRYKRSSPIRQPLYRLLAIKAAAEAKAKRRMKKSRER